MRKAWLARLGAVVRDGGTTFRVWAPRPACVSLVLDGRERPMTRSADGYWEAFEPGVGAGQRYRYRVDGDDLPDPCSRSQPDGVHADSETVDPRSFRWSDGPWHRPRPADLVIYECHIGTLTSQGTFDAAIGELPRLRGLGITAIELMPVASFPGTRNWGYDGVDLFAPAAVYGGADGLRRLVDAAHAAGLGVILDVVYNHFGPDGNYSGRFGPYLTRKHNTPWGDAVNFDDEGSQGVRDFIVENLLHWLHEYHIDGFRFDATHAIRDESPEHILAEVRRRISEYPRAGEIPYLIAETNENEPRYLRHMDAGGYGLDAIWADDFHHIVRNLLHGEREGYLKSFDGTIGELAHTIERGWLYEGQADPWSGHSRGAPAPDVPWRQLVFCLQNHDQVGNRAFGERITSTADLADIRAATMLLLLLPETPLIFQGQEYFATTPFLYFTDHEPGLGKAVTEGRRKEFAGFSAFTHPESRERIPDPQAESTFLRSKLNRGDMERPDGQAALSLHEELLRIRREDPVLRTAREGRPAMNVTVGERALMARLEMPAGVRLIAVNFGDQPAHFDAERVEVLFATSENSHKGEGLDVPPHSGLFTSAG